MSIGKQVKDEVERWGAPWTAAQTFTWVAFGEARTLCDNIEFPSSEWSHDWGQWPVKWLDGALVEIATDQPPVPNKDILDYRFDADSVGDQDTKYLSLFADEKTARERATREARALIASTGKTAAELIAALNRDVERYHANQDRLIKAQSAVVAAARDGLLKHLKARPAFCSNRPDLSAEHEEFPASLLYGARTITLFGTIEFDTQNSFDFLDNGGPWYDEFRFDSTEVKQVVSSDLLFLAFKRRNQEEIVSYQTGLRGRPSSKHLFLPYFAERLRRDECLKPIGAEASYVEAWLRNEHPKAAPATAKTIEEEIRAQYRTKYGPRKSSA